jgi:hypothetical protein
LAETKEYQITTCFNVVILQAAAGYLTFPNHLARNLLKRVAVIATAMGPILLKDHRRPAEWVIALVIGHHLHRPLAHFLRKLVRRCSYRLGLLRSWSSPQTRRGSV